MSLRIHIFQHVHFEDPGYILTWCAENNIHVSTTRFYEKVVIPEPDQYDCLIVMGGPMGVYDEKQYPWLPRENAAIDQAIKFNKPVIGICLGAQLIASVLGAPVYKNREKEIGWFDITLTPNGAVLPFWHEMDIRNMTVFHWHGDTFDLPEKAVLLASSSACKNQAFLWENKVIGLQFHFEVTERNLELMVEHGKEELIEGKYVQLSDAIIKNKGYITQNNKILSHILDWIIMQH